MGVDFGRNANDEIGMNPSRTIGIPRQQIISTIERTRTRKGFNCDILDSVSSNLDLFCRSSLWHGAAKSEGLGGNNIFENAERGKKIEVEKVDCKNSVIWNHKESDLIHVDPNHAD